MNATDVLICGAGAAGLTLAVELARRGVRFRLIDALPEPFRGSRGKGIQPRTLEVFQDLGVVDRLLASGAPYPPQREYRADGSFTDTQDFEVSGPTAAEPYRADHGDKCAEPSREHCTCEPPWQLCCAAPSRASSTFQSNFGLLTAYVGQCGPPLHPRVLQGLVTGKLSADGSPRSCPSRSPPGRPMPAEEPDPLPNGRHGAATCLQFCGDGGVTSGYDQEVTE